MELVRFGPRNEESEVPPVKSHVRGSRMEPRVEAGVRRHGKLTHSQEAMEGQSEGCGQHPLVVSTK